MSRKRARKLHRKSSTTFFGESDVDGEGPTFIDKARPWSLLCPPWREGGVVEDIQPWPGLSYGAFGACVARGTLREECLVEPSADKGNARATRVAGQGNVGLPQRVPPLPCEGAPFFPLCALP
jgi:hypothetical protein